MGAAQLTNLVAKVTLHSRKKKYVWLFFSTNSKKNCKVKIHSLAAIFFVSIYATIKNYSYLTIFYLPLRHNPLIISPYFLPYFRLNSCQNGFVGDSWAKNSGSWGTRTNILTHSNAGFAPNTIPCLQKVEKCDRQANFYALEKSILSFQTRIC